MASDYLNFGGWTTLPRPPFNCLGADFYGFSFPADRAACQQYLDKSYNAIAGRQKYRVLLDLVFLLYVKNTAIVALTPPFSNEGGIPETDAGFWLLVGSYDELAIFPSAIAWVPAYLFVDCALAVSVGREIMGYPKYFSNMTSPDTAPSAGPFTASAMLTRTFAPDAIASQQQFLSLQGSNFAAEPLESSAANCGFPSRHFPQTGRGREPRTFCGPSSRARTGANSCSIRISPFPSGTSGNSARPTARTRPSTRRLSKARSP